MSARARLINRDSTVRQRRRTFPFAFGGNVDSIDDATEVYGEWPEIDTHCDKSPVGQCEYAARDPERCIHCGRKT